MKTVLRVIGWFILLFIFIALVVGLINSKTPENAQWFFIPIGKVFRKIFLPIGAMGVLFTVIRGTFSGKTF